MCSRENTAPHGFDGLINTTAAVFSSIAFSKDSSSTSHCLNNQFNSVEVEMRHGEKIFSPAILRPQIYSDIHDPLFIDLYTIISVSNFGM